MTHAQEKRNTEIEFIDGYLPMLYGRLRASRIHYPKHTQQCQRRLDDQLEMRNKLVQTRDFVNRMELVLNVNAKDEL